MNAGQVRLIDKRNFSPVYEMSGLRRKLLAPVAYPLSLIYAAGVGVWRRRAVRGDDIGLPVISVGSITVGGSGKTPLSMLIAGDFAARGLRAAVVSRGYKRRRGPSPLIVRDFEGVRAGVEESGDEPYLMAMRLDGVAVVIDSDRLRGALCARDSLSPDVLLLDDGFQCRALRKRLDIVTLGPDALAPGAGHLPWGPLREGLEAIGRDDFVVLVARSDAERRALDTLSAGPPLEELRARPHFYVASYVDPVIVEAGGERAGAARDLGRAAVVSGIARPEGFEATCDHLGVEAAARIRFDDHHWYDEADRSMIERVMEETGCEWIATSEKDFWRMPGPLRARARAVRVSLRVEGPDFLKSVAERVFPGE